MSKTILIVDDDANLAGRVADLLEFENYTVHTAANGQGGLDMLGRVRPDLVLLDMNMPGMGGIGFLREFGKMELTDPPAIVVFTARGNMGGFFEGMGVAGYLTKPCESDVLLRTVSGALAARSLVSRPSGQASARTGKLLLAEDDDAAAARISDALTAAGWEVVKAFTGPEALEKAIICKPAVILSKLILTGTNGDKLAQAAGNIPTLRDTPFVLYDDTAVPRTEADIVGRASRIVAFVRCSEDASLVAAVGEVEC